MNILIPFSILAGGILHEWGGRIAVFVAMLLSVILWGLMVMHQSRKRTTLTALLLLLCASAHAGTVTLLWPPFAGPMAEYRLLIGPTTATNAADFPITKKLALPIGSVDLAPGTYRAAVQVVGTNGALSALTYSGAFQVRATKFHEVTVTLEGADNPAGPWKVVQMVMVHQPEIGELRFFRSRVDINTNAVAPPLPAQ